MLVGGPGSYLSAEVSLPAAGNRAVSLAELCGPGGVSEVDSFVSKSLLRRNMVAEKKRLCGLRAPYNDPELLRGTRYAHFVNELAARGIIEFVDAEEMVEIAGLFFVEKNKKLRLICDCRLRNLWFTEPDHVSLCTGEALAALEFEEDESCHVAEMDLRDAFYHLEFPQAIRNWFCFKGVRAGDVGVKFLDGKAVGCKHKLRPRLRVLPTGWSWALWWCRAIHCRIAERAGFAESERVVDKQVAPSVQKGAHIIYVDNFVPVSTDKEWAAASVRKMVTALNSSGLDAEVEDPHAENSGAATVLGWTIQRKLASIRASQRRIWRLRLAIRGIVASGYYTGRDMQRLAGHIGLVSLVRREGLAVLDYVFDLAENMDADVRNYGQAGLQNLSAGIASPLC